MPFSIQIIQILLVCVSFFIPLWPKAVPITIVLLSVFTLVLYFTQPQRKLSIFKYPITILCIIFYGTYIIGLLYSDNLPYAFFDLQVKLSFLVLPLIIVLISHYITINLKQLLWVFLVGCLIMGGFLLANAFYIYFYETHNIKVLFGSRMTRGIHPTYLGMYMNLCITFLLAEVFFKSGNRAEVAIKVLLSILFTVMVFFTASKAAIVVLLLTVIILVMLFIVHFKRFITGALIGLVAVLMFIFSADYLSIPLQRLNATADFFKKSNLDKTSTESNALRFMAWESSMTLIERNPVFGVGTGDVKDQLREVYENKGFEGALKKNLNSHNQFLQTYLSTGLLGLLSIIFLFFFLILSALKERAVIYIVFLLNIFFTAFTESVFEVQAGVVFFVFFASLFSVGMKGGGSNSLKLL